MPLTRQDLWIHTAALCSSKSLWTFLLHIYVLIRIKNFHWLIVKNENLIQTWDCVLGMAQFYLIPQLKVNVGHPSTYKSCPWPWEAPPRHRVAFLLRQQTLPFHPVCCLSDNDFLSCIDILIIEPEWGRLDHQQPANWECQKQRECGCRSAQEINLFSYCGFRVLCWCHSSLYRCCFKLTGKIFQFSDPWSLLSTW